MCAMPSCYSACVAPQLASVWIDRASPVPLYHQLAEQLTAAITSGSSSPATPSRTRWRSAERLGLSRPTVRRAIQGWSTRDCWCADAASARRVANRKVHRRAELTSLWDDLRRAGRHPDDDGPHPRVVQRRARRPPPSTSPPTARCSLVGGCARRRRPPRGHAQLAAAAARDIARDELEDEGLYAVLRDRGVRPVVAHQSIGARMPTPTERGTSRSVGSEPVLTMTRSAFDAVGKAGRVRRPLLPRRATTPSRSWSTSAEPHDL